MRHFILILSLVTVTVAAQVQPGAGQVVPAAARPKPVCYVGPANARPECIFDSVPQCRAACRTKRLHAGLPGRVQCFRNPALQQERTRRMLLVDAVVPERHANSTH